MTWLIEPFELALQQRALIGGSLAAIALLAVLVGFDLMLGAAIAALVMIGGINLVHRQTAFSEDTGIGLLFVGMLGLGVIIISRSDSFSGSLTSILFGDALGVTWDDIVVMAVVGAIVVVASLLLYRHFLVLAFNEQKATLLGLRPGLAHGVLLALITLAIIGSFQTVGTLLVFGLLVGPPATAALVVRRVPTMMLTAAIIGVLSVVIGLIISYHADTAGSATIAVTPVVLFFIVLTLRSFTSGSSWSRAA
jgi:ABC-type Mn2+/Zn2+ transport system permease subunit